MKSMLLTVLVWYWIQTGLAATPHSALPAFLPGATCPDSLNITVRAAGGVVEPVEGGTLVLDDVELRCTSVGGLLAPSFAMTLTGAAAAVGRDQHVVGLKPQGLRDFASLMKARHDLRDAVNQHVSVVDRC